jgi:hypothetical protein
MLLNKKPACQLSDQTKRKAGFYFLVLNYLFGL